MTASETVPRWVEFRRLDEIEFAEVNPKGHDAAGIGHSIDTHGVGELPMIDERTGRLVAGHGRIDALRERQGAGQAAPDGMTVDADGMWRVGVIRGWRSSSDQAARSYLIGSNQLTTKGGWASEQDLLDMLRSIESTDAALLAATGFSPGDIEELNRAVLVAEEDANRYGVTPPGRLVEQFLCPPFSVLDGRSGWWRERKRMWQALGFSSGGTRSGAGIPGLANLAARASDVMQTAKLIGASRFDPVLAELIVRWFCPDGGIVYDPFAGGSVRGIVTARTGRRYIGVDLRAEQCAWNDEECARINGQGGEYPAPRWITGDATAPPEGVPERADLLFTCPPYADLEQYSDDPADLSNMPIERFREMHGQAIRLACDRLADDAFAVWVIGEARGKDGGLYGLIPHTVDAFRAAGLSFATEAVLLTPVGTAAIGAARVFNGGRALARTHQNVLVFCKGNRSRAAKRLGPLDLAAAIAAAEEGIEPEEGMDE
jgi:hypothetical protein